LVQASRTVEGKAEASETLVAATVSHKIRVSMSTVTVAKASETTEAGPFPKVNRRLGAAAQLAGDFAPAPRPGLQGSLKGAGTFRRSIAVVFVSCC
jgi:hypothetical protein